MDLDRIAAQLDALPDGGVKFLGADVYAERKGGKFLLKTGDGKHNTFHRTARLAAARAMTLVQRREG